MAHQRQRSQTPSDSGGPGHPLLPPTPERQEFSINELLSAQAAQEAEAAKVLPWTFSKCSNPMGPGMRQAIYSCLTCNPKEGDKRAGVCSGCSISCHGDHGAPSRRLRLNLLAPLTDVLSRVFRAGGTVQPKRLCRSFPSTASDRH